MQMLKITIKPPNKHKMDSEEVQDYLKLKRGNGGHKSKKDYSRKNKHLYTK
jgi:hypothetical protein